MTSWKRFAAATLIFTSACITKETNDRTYYPSDYPEYSKTYTLQGVIADATTGARIGGSDLRLYLIQGADVRTPSRLNTGDTDPLLGEYAFAGIPADFNPANKRYKVVAVKPGYQRFEAEVAFVATTVPVLGVVDTVNNSIGNIFMFPLGASVPAFQYEVRYNGKPVPNATVQLDPAPNQNSATANPGNALGATNGLLASLTGTTDAAGTVTFAGSSLVLGGAYQAQVLPVAFTDSAGTTVQLARYKAPNNVVAGISSTVQMVALSDLSPAADSLYLVSASNQAAGQLNALGQLVITFNAPVSLVTPTGFTAVLASTTATLAAQPVTATLSTDGLTLTLAPNFATGFGTADRGSTVTYGDGTAVVSPRDYPAFTYQVFGDLRFADGTVPSGLVYARAP